MANDLPEEDSLKGETVLENWTLLEEEGRGGNGVVYKAEQDVIGDIKNPVACKLMPKEELREGWQIEIEKCARLYEHPNVVNFKDYGEVEIDGETYICYVTEYVNGPDLREYISDNSSQVTLSFVESVLIEILEVFYAMEQIGIHHNDLHPGNVLLSNSDLYISDYPTVKIADFGIGGSRNSLDPKDDYAQLGDITLDLLRTINKEELDSHDRFHYDFIVNDFIDKRVLETHPTQGDFVRSPEKLLDIINKGRSIARERLENEQDIELENPFDYLSCEQMGDSFELIEQLYSHNYPGYSQVQSKTNTILTGPRGCGKTTILKNMALETKIESGSITTPDGIDFIGVYYPCRDLYFAFHYLDEEPIYKEYSNAYRLVLAPTGSKLQTVGATLFHRLHTDVQAVYPVTKEFSDTYTEGWKATWGIDLGNIDETIEGFSIKPENEFTHLREKIVQLNNQVLKH